MNNRGLGRGIQALFDGGSQESVNSAETPFITVPIASISPNPMQPRQIFSEDRLAELALSIAAHGILQPLLVRPGATEGSYQLIAGERRLRAAKQAGLQDVPVICRELDDQETLIVTLLENLQRADLNPIEEARGVAALKEAMNATNEEIASTLGQAKGTIGNMLRLLKLPVQIQDDLISGRIAASHGRALCGLPTEEAMFELRDVIMEKNLPTRETENIVAYYTANNKFPWSDDPEGQSKKERTMKDPAIVRLANDIGALLKCRTRISGNSTKGRISIAYDSNAQLYDLLEKLGMQLDS